MPLSPRNRPHSFRNQKFANTIPVARRANRQRKSAGAFFLCPSSSLRVTREQKVIADFFSREIFQRHGVGQFCEARALHGSQRICAADNFRGRVVDVALPCADFPRDKLSVRTGD